MLSVAIIITTKGEKDKAADCLESCQRQIDYIGAEEKYSFSIFMNSQGVMGLESTWSHASKEGFDFYIFIDSDLTLAENALSVFLENSEFLRHKAIIVGSISRYGVLTFGGRTKRGKLIDPDPVIPVPCHLFDMDLVLIPRHAFDTVENPAYLFKISLLDYGYGNYAAKAGVARVIAPGVLAETKRKIEVPGWKNPEYNFWKRLGCLNVDLFQKLMRAIKSFI